MEDNYSMSGKFKTTKTIQKKMESAEYHGKLKREYPKYADKARQSLIYFLEKYDPDTLEIYLGNKNGLGNLFCVKSYDRYWVNLLAKNLCNWFEECDELNIPFTEWEQTPMDKHYKKYHLGMETISADIYSYRSKS